MDPVDLVLPWMLDDAADPSEEARHPQAEDHREEDADVKISVHAKRSQVLAGGASAVERRITRVRSSCGSAGCPLNSSVAFKMADEMDSAEEPEGSSCR